MHKSRLDDGSVLVAFELPAQIGAEAVSLVGDFNDWSADATPLVKQDDGCFRTELRLPAGRRSRFRYLLDGQRWENDWAADDYVPNGLGSDDSVVDLTDLSLLSAVSSDAPAAPATAEASGVVPTVPSKAESAEPVARRRWWQIWRRRVG